LKYTTYLTKGGALIVGCADILVKLINRF